MALIADSSIGPPGSSASHFIHLHKRIHTHQGLLQSSWTSTPSPGSQASSAPIGSPPRPRSQPPLLRQSSAGARFRKILTRPVPVHVHHSPCNTHILRAGLHTRLHRFRLDDRLSDSFRHPCSRDHLDPSNHPLRYHVSVLCATRSGVLVLAEYTHFNTLWDNKVESSPFLIQTLQEVSSDRLRRGLPRAEKKIYPFFLVTFKKSQRTFRYGFHVATPSRDFF